MDDTCVSLNRKKCITANQFLINNGVPIDDVKSTENSQVMSMMQSSSEHTRNGLNSQKLKNDKCNSKLFKISQFF